MSLLNVERDSFTISGPLVYCGRLRGLHSYRNAKSSVVDIGETSGNLASRIFDKAEHYTRVFTCTPPDNFPITYCVAAIQRDIAIWCAQSAVVPTLSQGDFQNLLQQIFGICAGALPLVNNYAGKGGINVRVEWVCKLYNWNPLWFASLFANADYVFFDRLHEIMRLINGIYASLNDTQKPRALINLASHQIPRHGHATPETHITSCDVELYDVQSSIVLVSGTPPTAQTLLGQLNSIIR